MIPEIEGSKFFIKQFKDKSFPKNKIITDFGQIENSLYFLEKGIVRFVVLKDFKEITFDFAFAR